MEQLDQTAELPGMTLAVVMPDLHPGKGHPIGAAFMTQGIFYPYLLGSDIGCGMGLWKTTLSCRKIKLDRWVKQLDDLDDSWDGDIKAHLADYGLETDVDDRSVGTIGGGNHFAELQRLESIEDETALNNLGLDRDTLLLLVHSGSRGKGEAILRSYTSKYGAQGVIENTLGSETLPSPTRSRLTVGES